MTTLIAAIRDVERQYTKSEDAGPLVRELIGCLRRLVPQCTVGQIHKAFGAPGDFGHGTPIGNALAELYNPRAAPVPLSDAVPGDAPGAASPPDPLAVLSGHRLVTRREPAGQSPTGRQWMPLTRDIHATLDEVAWCIREAERINAIDDRAALVWLRGTTVTLYVDRVVGAESNWNPTTSWSRKGVS
jgi:hypothetical protein